MAKKVSNRNEIIIESIKKQLLRIGANDMSLNDFLKYYLMEGIPTGIAIKYGFAGYFDGEITPKIFDDDYLLVETVKLIGIMESVKTFKEFTDVLVKRYNIKYESDMKAIKANERRT